MLVIPFKGWSNHGWFFTSSSQLYSALPEVCGWGWEQGAVVEGAALCCRRNRLMCSMCAAWHWKERCWHGEFCWVPSGFANLQRDWYLFIFPHLSAVLRKLCVLPALVQGPALCRCEWLPALLSPQLTQWTQCALSWWTCITNYLFFFF